MQLKRPVKKRLYFFSQFFHSTSKNLFQRDGWQLRGWDRDSVIQPLLGAGEKDGDCSSDNDDVDGCSSTVELEDGCCCSGLKGFNSFLSSSFATAESAQSTLLLMRWTG